MKDITTEEAVKDLKSLVEEYKDASVEGLNMQVDVGFNEERCRNLEKVLNELKKKDKIINAMTEWIDDRCFYSDDCGNSCEIIQDSCYDPVKDCKNCIKQYFDKEVKDD